MYLDLISRFNLPDNKVLNVFPYGSRVYGTFNELSDYDFIIVGDDSISNHDSSESGNMNALIYTQSSFQKKINLHDISCLECISLPKHKMLKNSTIFSFNLDLQQLRESISSKSSNSWVKAKKKFEVVKDRNVYIAKKSLFHSLRIINFGIQIAKHGNVIYFDSCNRLWEEIINNEADSWEPYKNKYQAYYNSQMTEFRKVAPKL